MLAAANSGNVLAAVVTAAIFILGGLITAVTQISQLKTQIKDIKQDISENRSPTAALTAAVNSLRVSVAVLEARVSGRSYRAPETLEDQPEH
jgi:cell division protein FtsL